MTGIGPLARAVESACYALDDAVCREIWALFDRCARDPAQARDLRPTMGERDADEQLVPVDSHGEPTVPSSEVLAEHDARCRAQPALAQWLRALEGPGSGGPVLAAARWLCHAAGLRHRSVHLLLHHPLQHDHLVVQLRAATKKVAAGCLDLPVAGHVVGLDSVEATLAKECAEELGIELCSVKELRPRGAWVEARLGDPPGFRDVEHHTVFDGRLSHEGWQMANARSDEVAGVCAVRLSDLRALEERFPERVAPGLAGLLARESWARLT